MPIINKLDPIHNRITMNESAPSTKKNYVLPGSTGQVFKLPSGNIIYNVDGTHTEYQYELGGQLTCNLCCKNSGHHACPRCGVTRYCSDECEWKHWKVHKHGCVGASPANHNTAVTHDQVTTRSKPIPFLAGRVYKYPNDMVLYDPTYMIY